MRSRPGDGAWAVGAFLHAVALLALVPMLVGAQVLAHPSSWRWSGVVGHCWPFLGGFLGVVIGRLLKTPERRREEWAATRAVWSGKLPERADPGEWRRPVRLQVREAVVSALALLVLGVAGGALTAGAAARSGHDSGALWALAAAQEIAAVALILMCLRMVGNGRRMQAES